MSLTTEPPHEYEPTSAAPEAAETPAHGAPEATTRQQLRTLEQLRDTHGDAFLAYQAHVWDGTPIEQIENDFINVYWASYPDRKTFIDSFLDGLGWQENYEYLIAHNGIPDGALNWNYPFLLARLQEDYELLDLGGSVHVLLK